MKILTQEQLETVRPVLESIGFTGLPAANVVDWSKPTPMVLNVNGGYEKLTTSNVSMALAPVN